MVGRRKHQEKILHFAPSHIYNVNIERRRG